MKRLYTVLLVLLFLISCEDNDSNPSGPYPYSYNGTFDCRSLIISNDCKGVVLISIREVQIEVRRDKITFSDIEGDWDKTAMRGSGISDPRCFQYESGCRGCYQLKYDITYSDYENFQGTYEFILNMDDENCTINDCTARYSIVGMKR